MNERVDPVYIDLTNPAYVQKTLSRWRYFPKSMIVVEYCDTLDPNIEVDDFNRRELGVDGLMGLPSSEAGIAQFATIQQAHAAALRIPNRRPDSILGVIPRWK